MNTMPRSITILQLAVVLSVLLVFNTASAAHSHGAGAHDATNRYSSYRKRTVRSGLQVPGRTVKLLNSQSKDTVGIRSSLQSSILLRGGSTSTISTVSTASNKEVSVAAPSTESASNKEVSVAAPSTESPSSWNRDLAVFQSSSFLIVLSLALVAFSPAPALVAEIGTERATSTLSILSASAALTEIIMSPALGSMLDSIGRKPALVFTLLAIAMSNGAVSIHPSVITICTAKFVGMLCAGLFFIASQVIISDIVASNPERMSSTLGVQFALIGAAFFVGAIAAGQLSGFGLSVTYGSSAVVAALTAMLVSLGMRETLVPSKRVPFQAHIMRKRLLQSPFSCTRILYRHTKEVRILAIILMLQSFPGFMGDVFQILAKTEWKLDTKDFSSFVAMFGIINIAANIVGSQMVRKLGIKRFTALATLSSMLAPIGASFFSFRGLIVGSIMGFLGSAQMLGVTAALVAEGAKSGAPQGELAGERSSFIALIKVIGPIWYSMLYVQGKKVLGWNNLPFLFNIGVGLGTFTISQLYLPR
jgi:predicted MFS family arabinose efflux permease